MNALPLTKTSQEMSGGRHCGATGDAGWRIGRLQRQVRYSNPAEMWRGREGLYLKGHLRKERRDSSQLPKMKEAELNSGTNLPVPIFVPWWNKSGLNFADGGVADCQIVNVHNNNNKMEHGHCRQRWQSSYFLVAMVRKVFFSPKKSHFSWKKVAFFKRMSKRR